MTAAERVRVSRAAQGLPPTVEDPGVLARVAALLAPNSDEHRVSTPGARPVLASGRQDGGRHGQA